MAHSSYHSHDYNPQINSNSDLNYNSLLSSTQQCSIYSTQPDISSSHQHSRIVSQENGNDEVDNKPALPPKPLHGPPVYREPPCPPINDESNCHPDICINSPPIHQKPLEPTSFSHLSHSGDRPERLGSRTHAWVQEHKTSGKLVGEKLSSLQRKLRSFLSQSASSKDCTELEKPNVIDDPSKFESTSRSQIHGASHSSMNRASTSEQHLNYMAPSLYSGNSVALPFSQSTNHPHIYKSIHSDRHPFAASSNTSEHEDSTDPDQLRDTCSKFFAREQRISWTNYLSSRNCYSNNIKSSYDHDKLVPKEVIGKPSQERKSEIAVPCEAIYGDITPLPSFNKALDVISHQSEVPLQTKDSSLSTRRIHNVKDDSNHTEAVFIDNKVPNHDLEIVPPEPLSSSIPDCVDATDIYKSSSESGRGTMHSSRHGSKSIVSPHSSGVSAASNLDTSLDSDQSGNGAIWKQQSDNCIDKEYSEDFPINQVRHIYETPNSTKCQKTTKDDDATSESLSITPPLPPLSEPPSPPVSAENSPKLSTKAKYKLSQSASALNTHSFSNDHQQRIECVPKSSSKKPGIRRTSSINQAPCRHRSGKSQFSKSSVSAGHGLSVSHINCGVRKCSSSPPSRHMSRNQLAYSCYLDNVDPELTSTTTGLDMESLLDEDDYSSDISASASTMEPSEVSMIRKQLEGLETMYSEILRILGCKNSPKGTSFTNQIDISRHSRRKLNGSLSSLNARSSATRSTHSFVDKRGYSEKRHVKELRTSSAGKRLQRLESHVVTLARSVAHLSSEMRTQHVLVQELENMRQDVTWVQERLRLMQLAQGCHSGNNGSKNHQLAMPRDWDNFHKEVLELLNPCRAKKLTKFFGDEPPLIRQFLKRLGYEKYAVNFENEKVGIKELPYLTEERLQKMGIPMGPRIRILQEAHACQAQNQYKVYIV